MENSEEADKRVWSHSKAPYSCDKMDYKICKGFIQLLTAFWRDVYELMCAPICAHTHTHTHTLPFHSGNVALVVSTQFYSIVFENQDVIHSKNSLLQYIMSE